MSSSGALSAAEEPASVPVSPVELLSSKQSSKGDDASGYQLNLEEEIGGAWDDTEEDVEEKDPNVESEKPSDQGEDSVTVVSGNRHVSSSTRS